MRDIQLRFHVHIFTIITNKLSSDRKKTLYNYIYISLKTYQLNVIEFGYKHRGINCIHVSLESLSRRQTQEGTNSKKDLDTKDES